MQNQPLPQRGLGLRADPGLLSKQRDSGGPEQTSEAPSSKAPRGPCEEPRPAGIACLSASLEDLQEVQRPWRGHDQAARAMEQADARQITDGPLDVVALSEVLRSAGDLADQVRDRQQGRVSVQDVHEGDALISYVFGGGRDLGIAAALATTLAMHGS